MDKYDPATAHILPRPIKLKGEIPKGEALISDSVLEDKDLTSTTVLCYHCKTPLYKIIIKKVFRGQPMSTQTEYLGDWPKNWNENEIKCPSCGSAYFKVAEQGYAKFWTSKGWM